MRAGPVPRGRLLRWSGRALIGFAVVVLLAAAWQWVEPGFADVLRTSSDVLYGARPPGWRIDFEAPERRLHPLADSLIALRCPHRPGTSSVHYNSLQVGYVPLVVLAGTLAALARTGLRWPRALVLGGLATAGFVAARMGVLLLGGLMEHARGCPAAHAGVLEAEWSREVVYRVTGPLVMEPSIGVLVPLLCGLVACASARPAVETDGARREPEPTRRERRGLP